MTKPDFSKVQFNTLRSHTRESKTSFARLSTAKNKARWLSLAFVSADRTNFPVYAGINVEISEGVLTEPPYEGRRVLKVTHNSAGTFKVRHTARGESNTLLLRLGNRDWFPAQDIEPAPIEIFGSSESPVLGYIVLPPAFNKSDKTDQPQPKPVPEVAAPRPHEPKESSLPAETTRELEKVSKQPVATAAVAELANHFGKGTPERSPPPATPAEPSTPKPAPPKLSRREMLEQASNSLGQAVGPRTTTAATNKSNRVVLNQFDTCKLTGTYTFPAVRPGVDVAIPRLDGDHHRLFFGLIQDQHINAQTGISVLHRKRFPKSDDRALSSLEDTKQALLELASFLERSTTLRLASRDANYWLELAGDA